MIGNSLRALELSCRQHKIALSATAPSRLNAVSIILNCKANIYIIELLKKKFIRNRRRQGLDNILFVAYGPGSRGSGERSRDFYDSWPPSRFEGHTARRQTPIVLYAMVGVHIPYNSRRSSIAFTRDRDAMDYAARDHNTACTNKELLIRSPMIRTGVKVRRRND